MFKMKKTLFPLIILISLCSIFGCGKKDTENNKETINMLNLTATPTPEPTATPSPEPISEITEAPIDPSEVSLVPKVKLNTENDLSLIVLNDKEIDISNITLEDFLSQTGTYYFPYGSTALDKKEYSFYGGMYSVKDYTNPEITTSGSTYSLELIHKTDGLLMSGIVNMSEAESYMVQGIHVDEFFMEDDLTIVFGGGIVLGMTEDEAFQILGEGVEIDSSFDDIYGYNNGECTLLLAFDYEGLDAITLIKNE